MDYYNWYVCWWQQEYQGGFWTWRHEGVTNIEHLIEHGTWFDVQNQDQHYIINLLNGWDNNNNSSPPVSESKRQFTLWIHAVDSRFSVSGNEIPDSKFQSLVAFRIPSVYLEVPKPRIPVSISKNILDSGFHKQIPEFCNRTTLYGAKPCQKGSGVESLHVSGKLPTYPSPKPTLTLTILLT